MTIPAAIYPSRRTCLGQGWPVSGSQSAGPRISTEFTLTSKDAPGIVEDAMIAQTESTRLITGGTAIPSLYCLGYHCTRAASHAPWMQKMETKTCTKCSETKPFTEFYKMTDSKDGLTASCRSCRAKYDQDRRQQRRDYRRTHKEQARAWHRSDVGKASKRRYRSTRKLETNAQQACRRAVAAGTIKTGNCRICGEQNTQAHHHDYNKPLKVDWLCQIHHKLIHRWLRTIKRILDNSKQQENKETQNAFSFEHKRQYHVQY